MEKEVMHICSNLDYIKYDNKSLELQALLKRLIVEVEYNIQKNLSSSREKSLALTRLEECWMWVGKSIKIDQIKRGGNEVG